MSGNNVLEAINDRTLDMSDVGAGVSNRGFDFLRKDEIFQLL